jgi:hypothetical protein
MVIPTGQRHTGPLAVDVGFVRTNDFEYETVVLDGVSQVIVPVVLVRTFVPVVEVTADMVLAELATTAEPAAKVDSPVPPSATAKSVIPVIDPPDMDTLLAACEAIVPNVGLFAIEFPPVA